MSIAFTFDAAVHAYVVDNQLQPHVTGILEHYGVIDYSGVPVRTLQRKSLIGTMVHRATHHMDEDGLKAELAIEQIRDEFYGQMAALQVSHEDLLGYTLGWKRFMKESGFRCLPGFIERKHVAEVNGMKYGMTIDRAGKLGRKHTILDLKCTHAKEKSWPIQLAGYRLGLPKPSGVVRWEADVIWLKPDGQFSRCPGGRNHTDPVIERRDEEVFLAALRLTWWKQENLGHF